MCEATEDNNQKPQVIINNIDFNDGSRLSLNQNSIVIFTGGNNCGKSQVLKDIENGLDNKKKEHLVVISNIDYRYDGMMNDKFINNRAFMNEQGNYMLPNSSYLFNKDTFYSVWENHCFYNDLNHLFIKRLDTEHRITTSNPLNRNQEPEKHPIFKLYNNNKLMEKLSSYFHQAFDVDLIINTNEMQTIPMHIGNAPDQKMYTIQDKDEYYSIISNMPKLHTQGDGMRSFASILLDTFTSEYSITLIDEPEAFLHPPQARVLGKMLATNNPSNRQLFISTHSEDFLQGLLDADNENVTVIRINRSDNKNIMSILRNDKIKELWRNPLLRYSNILNGLFHDKVVVCESDYDCLFYQAIMNAMIEERKEIAPDILFTHCGGKNRIKDAVTALRVINVPVVAICDFDILNSKQDFRQLFESFGLNWNDELEKNMKIFYDTINCAPELKEMLKDSGKHVLTGEAPVAFENIDKICRNTGLYIVPFGEMESFDKTTNKKKKDWVYSVLEKYVLAIEKKLNDAKDFIQGVLDFQI